MARKIRIECAGAAYHVMARGNQGWDIYADERDRKLWLATLSAAILFGIACGNQGGAAGSKTDNAGLKLLSL